MMNTVPRLLAVTVVAMMTLALSATPARSQGAPPPPRAPRRDTTVLELPAGRVPLPPRAAPAAALPSRLQRPTPPVNLPVTRTSVPPDTTQTVAAAVAPDPLPPTRTVPPPRPVASAAPAAATRSVSVVPPAGSTGQCKDGTYLTVAATEQACASHEGLAIAFSKARQTPRRQ